MLSHEELRNPARQTQLSGILGMASNCRFFQLIAEHDNYRLDANSSNVTAGHPLTDHAYHFIINGSHSLGNFFHRQHLVPLAAE